LSKLATASVYLILISRMVPSLREARFGVEAYKRLRATVFLGDVDAHAEIFVVFGRDQLDIFEDSHLDLFIAVHVE